MHVFLSHLDKLTRRDFLKFASLGFLTLGIPKGSFLIPARSQFNLLKNGYFLKDTAFSMGYLAEADSTIFGRVVQLEVGLYAKPSFSAKQLKTLWTDVVMPITDITVGDETPVYNRVWYNLDGQGYAHSGVIQPVQVRTNNPDDEIPSTGRLAELTVPFSDTRWWAPSKDATAYRLYYATTHWVTGLTYDNEGLPLYKIYVNLIKRSYYAPARHFRLVPPEELAPISADIPPEAKRIEVHLAEQVVIAYEYDRPVFMARAATGAHFSNGIFSTPTGPLSCFTRVPPITWLPITWRPPTVTTFPASPGFHISPKMVLLFTVLTGIMTLGNREVMAALTSHLKPLVGFIFGQRRWSPPMFRFPLIKAAQRLM